MNGIRIFQSANEKSFCAIDMTLSEFIEGGTGTEPLHTLKLGGFIVFQKTVEGIPLVFVAVDEDKKALKF